MEGISNDTVLPPFTPGKDIHAQSQSMIGTFDEDISKIIMIEEVYRLMIYQNNNMCIFSQVFSHQLCVF